MKVLKCIELCPRPTRRKLERVCITKKEVKSEGGETVIDLCSSEDNDSDSEVDVIEEVNEEDEGCNSIEILSSQNLSQSLFQFLFVRLRHFSTCTG